MALIGLSFSFNHFCFNKRNLLKWYNITLMELVCCNWNLLYEYNDKNENNSSNQRTNIICRPTIQRNSTSSFRFFRRKLKNYDKQYSNGIRAIRWKWLYSVWNRIMCKELRDTLQLKSKLKFVVYWRFCFYL